MMGENCEIIDHSVLRKLGLHYCHLLRFVDEKVSERGEIGCTLIAVGTDNEIKSVYKLEEW